jgi:hypothetical protein
MPNPAADKGSVRDALLAVMNAQEATSVLLYTLIHNLEMCRRSVPSIGDAGQNDLKESIARIEAAQKKVEDLLMEVDGADSDSVANRLLSRIERH